MAKHRPVTNVVNVPTPREVTGETIAKDLADFVNKYGHRREVQLFVDTMASQHRTLQQQSTGVMLVWFKHLSELDESWYDARNEHAVKVAKKIRAVLEAEYGSAWCHMPLI